MNVRSYMVVNDTEPGRKMVYVLVEGAVNDCAVYMCSWPEGPVTSFEINETASGGAKVSLRDVDALPFKIPSHLTYRR